MKYYLKNKKNTASYNEEINDVILKIENIFGTNIASEIKNIRFYYEGFHNITYIGKFKNKDSKKHFAYRLCKWN